MRRLLGPAWAIARRDYVATVWTRTFLLFLAGPLLPLLAGGLFGALAADGPDAAGTPIVVAAPTADLALLRAAHARVAARLGMDWLPPLARTGPAHAVRLSGDMRTPELAGPPAAVRRLRGRVGLLLDTAMAIHAGLPAPVAVAARPTRVAADRTEDRRALARTAQFVLFFVTAVLAGMLISNLVEEKSNKVIELLAAAVPVDAIFLGKLVGMLGVSLTALAVWGPAAAAGGLLLLPGDAAVTPAVGWPAFAALAFAYWLLLYLLLGALYLGVGAQAASVREVQSLSLPLTVGQVLFLGLGQAAVGRADAGVGLLAAIVPWSSPFAMVARAAERAELWPHLLALAWQAACVALAVRVGARLFRRTVLLGGGGARKRRWLSYLVGRRRA